jgi:hypothetical protein
MEFQFTYPREYARELAKAIGQYATLGMAEDTNALNDGVLSDDAFIALCDSLILLRPRFCPLQARGSSEFMVGGAGFYGIKGWHPFGWPV